MRSLPVVVAIALAACGTFGSTTESSPGAGEDGGAEGRAASDATPGDGAAADGEAADGAAVDAAGNDAASPVATCVDFTTASPPDWFPDVTGGAATLTQATRDGRPALIASVGGPGQRAVLVRNLPTRADGHYVITIDVNTVVGATGAVGWLTTLVKARCTPPELAAFVALAPNTIVDSEASPSSTPPGEFPRLAGWQKLTLTIHANTIEVGYGANTRTIMTTASFANRAGCTLEIGADAAGNIPQTTAAFSRVCLQ